MASDSAREFSLKEIVDRLPVCATDGKRHRGYEELQTLEQELEEYRRLQKGCPSCIKGEPARALLDCDGVFTSVSGKSGQWGHSWDDYHWFCADAGAIAENTRLREALKSIRDGGFSSEYLAEGVARAALKSGGSDG